VEPRAREFSVRAAFASLRPVGGPPLALVVRVCALPGPDLRTSSAAHTLGLLSRVCVLMLGHCLLVGLGPVAYAPGLSPPRIAIPPPAHSNVVRMYAQNVLLSRHIRSSTPVPLLPLFSPTPSCLQANHPGTGSSPSQSKHGHPQQLSHPTPPPSRAS